MLDSWKQDRRITKRSIRAALKEEEYGEAEKFKNHLHVIEMAIADLTNILKGRQILV